MKPIMPKGYSVHRNPHDGRFHLLLRGTELGDFGSSSAAIRWAKKHAANDRQHRFVRPGGKRYRPYRKTQRDETDGQYAQRLLQGIGLGGYPRGFTGEGRSWKSIEKRVLKAIDDACRRGDLDSGQAAWLEEYLGFRKKNPARDPERTYRILAVNDRKKTRSVVLEGPFTHREATTILKKMSHHAAGRFGIRYLLEQR